MVKYILLISLFSITGCKPYVPLSIGECLVMEGKVDGQDPINFSLKILKVTKDNIVIYKQTDIDHKYYYGVDSNTAWKIRRVYEDIPCPKNKLEAPDYDPNMYDRYRRK